MSSHSVGRAVPKPLSLRRNFSWSFVGNVVYGGCQWGMLAALAKLGTPEIVGQFALALAITTPVIVFSSLRLRTVQVTDARGEFVFGDYLGLRLVTTVLALAVIAGIALLGGFRREMVLLIMLLGLSQSFVIISDVIYALLQKQERMDRIACLRMIKGGMALAAMATVMYFTRSLVWSMAALAAARLASLAFDVPSAAWALGSGSWRSMWPRWHTPTLGRMVWVAFPLGLSAVAESLNTVIPRYFVEHHVGEYELGVFAALSYVVFASNTMAMAMAESAVPRLAKLYVAGSAAAFCRLVLRLMALWLVLGVAIVAVVWLAGAYILSALYTPEYAEYSDEFFWIAVATAISYQAFLGPALTALRRFKAFMAVWLVALVTLIAASAILVPEYGLTGAIAAVIIANAVRFVVVHAALWTGVWSSFRESSCRVIEEAGVRAGKT